MFGSPRTLERIFFFISTLQINKIKTDHRSLSTVTAIPCPGPRPKAHGSLQGGTEKRRMKEEQLLLGLKLQKQASNAGLLILIVILAPGENGIPGFPSPHTHFYLTHNRSTIQLFSFLLCEKLGWSSSLHPSHPILSPLHLLLPPFPSPTLLLLFLY